MRQQVYVGPVVVCASSQAIDAWRVLEHLREALCPAMEDQPSTSNAHFWIPNQDRQAPRQFSIEAGEVHNSELDSITIIRDVAWMQYKFSKELDLLRDIYENVRVEWRILVWSVH